MQPGQLPEEYEDNSPQAELARDDASPAEAAEARRGIRGLEGGQEGNGQPQGRLNSTDSGGRAGLAAQNDRSADAAATARAAKGSGGAGAAIGGATGAAGAGNPMLKLGKGKAKGGKSLMKRPAVIAGVAGITAVISIAGFLGMLALKLVDFEENVVAHFDKRIEHTISGRMGSHYEAIFDKAGNVRGYKNVGHPLTDWVHNYNMPRLEADMKAKGLSPVHDSGGKVVGFLKDSRTDTSKKTKAVLDGETIKVVNESGSTIHSFGASDQRFLDARNTKLKDRRSILRAELHARYPEVGFFRLALRARRLDARMGIKRKFLENRREKFADKRIEWLTKIRDGIKSRISNSDSTGPPTEEARARDALEAEANANGDNARGVSPKAIAAGGLALVVQACSARSISRSLQAARIAIRSAQLTRIAFVYLPTAHQIKEGDIHPEQLAALMGSLKGFETAGGWQRITGKKNAKVTDSDKFTVDHESKLGAVADGLDKVPGIKPICNVVDNTGVLGFAALDVALAVAAVYSGGAAVEIPVLIDTVVTTAIQSVGIQVAIGKAMNLVVDKAKEGYSKPILDPKTATPQDNADAVIAGYDNYANSNARGNGGQRLTKAQVATLNSQADQDIMIDAHQRGLAYQIFSPNYSHSLVTSLVRGTPSSPSTVTSNYNAAIASIMSPFSGKQLGSIGSFLLAHTKGAEAFSGASEEEDPTGYGVPQYGLPDELLQKYPVPEDNETWVLQHLCAKGQTLYDGQNCANPSASSDANGELLEKNNEHQDDYHEFVRTCLESDNSGEYLDNDKCKSHDEVYERYRVYRLDLGIANMLQSYNNDDNDQEDPDGKQKCAAAAPDTATAPDTGPKNIYIMGDSIAVGAYYAGDTLKSALDKAHLSAYVDASGGRGLTYGGGDTANNRPQARVPGLKALVADKAEIAKADTVVIEMGTNTSGTAAQFKTQMEKAIAEIKAANSTATIYWVEIFSKGPSLTTAKTYTDYNKVIEKVAAAKNVQVIKTAGLGVELSSDQIHPAPKGYSKLSQLIVDSLGKGTAVATCISNTSDNATDTAGASFDLAKINESSAKIACAPGTKDLGNADGYHNNVKIPLRICAIPGFPSSSGESHDQFGVKGAGGNVVVNSRVSGAVLAMVVAAKKDNISLGATSSFRTKAHQQALCPCNGVDIGFPGYSNHGMGMAIDFQGLPSTPSPGSGKIWDWLAKNAKRFGYKNYPHEAWHWSPTGN